MRVACNRAGCATNPYSLSSNGSHQNLGNLGFNLHGFCTTDFLNEFVKKSVYVDVLVFLIFMVDVFEVLKVNVHDTTTPPSLPPFSPGIFVPNPNESNRIHHSCLFPFLYLQIQVPTILYLPLFEEFFDFIEYVMTEYVEVELEELNFCC
ncbi:hypothetical protein L6452_06538 [Arctium lappa]|uniref:Uncharacterized protein n=1 Tax=Arctium lappa TaxID=4217 RepID=A0ACB9EJP8_ARCLA|nr:hypothetical protein L6452_06538 [Arctium lappa]